MASYLLNSDDEAMERWKQAAKLRRLPFSEFLRQAAETFTALPPSAPPAKPPNTVDALPGRAKRRQQEARSRLTR